MPIVIEDLSGIGRGIESGSSALASALEKRAERRLTQTKRTGLDKVLQDSDLSTQKGQQNFYREFTGAGGEGSEAKGILDTAIKQQRASQQGFVTENPEELASTFTKFGIPEKQSLDYANFYNTLTPGGKTSFTNMMIDKMQRGDFKSLNPAELSSLGSEVQSDQELGDAQPESEEFQYPEVDMFESLTPKERVSRQKDLFNANAKDFSEVTKKSKSLKSEGIKLDQLERLNNTGKLPEGIKKLNVNFKTGDLVAPAGANTETQQYVKTVNDFLMNIKESFGARITDFDIKSFMKRLPTLANSTEGRRVILSQMKALNDLDKLEKSSLKDVYDHYGLRGIDIQKAEKIAEEMRAPQEEALKQKVADSIQAQEVFQAKKVVPAGKLPFRSPEGKIVFILSEQIEKATEKGYTQL